MNKTKRNYKRLAGIFILTLGISTGALAQNSVPAPGSGGSFNPAPSNGIGWNPGPGPGPMAPPPPSWGGPWGSGIYYSPSIVVNIPTNSGVKNVVACGYDAQGVWRTLPLRVSYTYNGVQYSVTVLNAWNPWTDMWMRGVDQPAYNTTYYINGQQFNFYTVLSTGTFYFNL